MSHITEHRPEVLDEIRERIRTQAHRDWHAAIYDLKGIALATEAAERASCDTDKVRSIFRPYAAIAASALFFAVSIFYLSLPAGAPAGLELADIERLKGIVTIVHADALTERASEQFSVRSGQIIKTQENSGAGIRLSSGAYLRLDENSRFKAITEDQFELMSGALYYDSGTVDADRSISVITPLGRVYDIGTQYELRLIPNAISLKVREGGVELRSLNGDTQRVLALAAAKEELIISESGKSEHKPIKTYGKIWQWTQYLAPVVELDGLNLEQFLDWFVRENGWQLEYAQNVDRAIRSSRLHGSVQDMNAQQIMSVISATSDVRLGLSDGVLSVYTH